MAVARLSLMTLMPLVALAFARFEAQALALAKVRVNFLMSSAKLESHREGTKRVTYLLVEAPLDRIQGT